MDGTTLNLLEAIGNSKKAFSQKKLLIGIGVPTHKH